MSDSKPDIKKSPDVKNSSDSANNLSPSPKSPAKPMDLKLTPVLHRKSSPLLPRQKIKRTKSADKFTTGLPKSPSVGTGLTDLDRSYAMDDESSHRTKFERAKLADTRRSQAQNPVVGNDRASQPPRYVGYLLKNRKLPMKGWHKRYFIVDCGMLMYAKTQSDAERGRYHATMDLGFAFLSHNRKRCRIDIDSGDLICHIKTKTPEQFDTWTTYLYKHSVYRSSIVANVSSVEDFVSLQNSPIKQPSGNGPDALYVGMDRPSCLNSPMSPTFLADSHSSVNTGLSMAQQKLDDLSGLLSQLQQAAAAAAVPVDLAINGPEPIQSNMPAVLAVAPSAAKVEKQPSYRRHFVGRLGRRDKPKDQQGHPGPAVTVTPADATDCLADPSANADDGSLQTDLLKLSFSRLATDVYGLLENVYQSVVVQSGRLQQVVEQQLLSPSSYNNSTGAMKSLLYTLNETQKQNDELRSRLQRIHADSSVAVFAEPITPSMATASPLIPNTLSPVQMQLRRMTSARVSSLSIESPCEFYDAAEQLESSGSDYSEETEDEDASDAEQSAAQATTATAADEVIISPMSRLQPRRRSKLPAVKQQSDVGLWSLLSKNIGKDLSKISMPVSLNEPLNSLQRICEELEYSDLLDQASNTTDPNARMVLVAAFAVSSYASTATRCAHKPFNPLLGETFEFIREEQGWKYIAEQVKHHPAISACYCESSNFVFWQDMQIKTKFWGKSMEVQPLGFVHVKLFGHFSGEEYSWNKASSCIHNILGGQRWVEHHGEVIVTNHSLNIQCKLTFVKSSYWSDKRHEVYGSVYDSAGKVVTELFGKWSEGIYCGDSKSAKCVWRPGAVQPDAQLYYGFSRFAIELNEIEKDQERFYPITDTRFRPDQRLLEEGKLLEAENQKLLLEQLQRDRLKQQADKGIEHSPHWFTKVIIDGKETYQYNGNYWQTRQDPGFKNVQLTKLW